MKTLCHFLGSFHRTDKGGILHKRPIQMIYRLCCRTLSDPIANSTFREMYIPTHTRASPYFIGMAAGYLRYLIKKNDTKLPKVSKIEID
jgi:hypothetical protein